MMWIFIAIQSLYTNDLQLEHMCSRNRSLNLFICHKFIQMGGLTSTLQGSTQTYTNNIRDGKSTDSRSTKCWIYVMVHNFTRSPNNLSDGKRTDSHLHANVKAWSLAFNHRSSTGYSNKTHHIQHILSFKYWDFFFASRNTQYIGSQTILTY